MTMEVTEDELRKNLNDQLLELELLGSMYTSDELNFEPNSDISDLKLFLNGHVKTIANTEFSLKIKDDLDLELCLEATFYLSFSYPSHKAISCFARCTKLTGAQLSKLNENCRDYVASLPLNEPQIVACIEWLKNEVNSLNDADKTRIVQQTERSKSLATNANILVRFWIYSHHLYSKFKRKYILDLANKLHLTGFSMPGKPGVICVEGPEPDCLEFWDEVRSWPWQRITLKHSEKSIEDNRVEFCKFDNFQEITFQANHGNEKHPDMGQFLDFLREKRCADMFEMLFNIIPK